jgi:hypothetical protein
MTVILKKGSTHSDTPEVRNNTPVLICYITLNEYIRIYLNELTSMTFVFMDYSVNLLKNSLENLTTQTLKSVSLCSQERHILANYYTASTVKHNFIVLF